MDCGPPGSSAHGVLQARFPFPPSRDLDQGVEFGSSVLQANSIGFHMHHLAWRIHGQRSLLVYRPRSPKESDRTEQLSTHNTWIISFNPPQKSRKSTLKLLLFTDEETEVYKKQSQYWTQLWDCRTYCVMLATIFFCISQGKKWFQGDAEGEDCHWPSLASFPTRLTGKKSEVQSWLVLVLFARRKWGCVTILYLRAYVCD